MCKPNSFHNRLYVLFSFGYAFFSFDYVLLLFGYALFSLDHELFSFGYEVLPFHLIRDVEINTVKLSFNTFIF